MAFQYASYANPQPQESSLAALLPAFEAGQQQRKDELAAQAFASLGHAPGQAPSALADLSAPQQQPQPAVGPDGHPVAVGDRAADLTAYQSGVAARESGGNPAAVNPRSGATGTYQFLPSTWQDVSARHPELGLTPDGITDPAQQQKAMQVFTSENARQLQANGIPPSPANLYAAHFLGGAGASKVLAAPDQTPLSAVVSPAAISENPNIANMTVGDFKAWAGQNGGNASGGYAPPAAQPQPTGPADGGNGLPDRETMLALFRSPETRQLAMQMVATVRAGQSPAGLLDLATKQAQLAKTEQEITGGVIPPNYRRGPDGNLQAIPGGPDDPNNPLNAMKTGLFGQTMSGNTQVGTDENGAAIPQQQADFLKTLPPSLAGVVKSIGDYGADITKVTSMRGPQRLQMMQLVQQYNPTFDMAQYPARAAYLKKVQSGAYADSINSANTTIDHLSQLLDNSGELNNSSFPAWNSVANTVKTQTGSAAVTNFNENAKAAGDELAKFFKGTGATDVGSIENWGRSLDANASPDQQHGAVDTAIGLLKSRLDVLRQQYEQTLGRPASYAQFLHPDTMQTLIKLGYDPQTLDRSNGPHPSNPSTPDASAAPVQIKGDDDFNALPSGAKFLDPDGNLRQKP